MTGPDRRIRAGTRTSRLALIQTAMFQGAAAAAAPGTAIEVVGVSTAGDRRPTVPIPDLGQGAFVKELEVALILEEVDVAVHSLKDLPTSLPPGLTLGAVLNRGDPRDALVSHEGKTLIELPPGSRVGTGSPRRTSQIRERRPDVEVVLIRGNVDTRIRNVIEDRTVDAVVLAAAGLIRMGLSHLITEYLDPSSFLPAVGQGFLGVECRGNDQATMALLSLIEDSRSRRAADMERSFLAAVGGFCKTPLAARAEISADGSVVLEGLIANHDGTIVLRDRVHGDAAFAPVDAGNQLKEALFAKGGGEIIAAAEKAWPLRDEMETRED